MFICFLKTSLRQKQTFTQQILTQHILLNINKNKYFLTNV